MLSKTEIKALEIEIEQLETILNTKKIRLQNEKGKIYKLNSRIGVSRPSDVFLGVFRNEEIEVE